jgi:small subunit ribosomal protein S6
MTAATAITKKRNYHATFILDNRGHEETIDQIVEGVKKDITAVHGEVTGEENIGKRDFIRVTDKKLTGATYVHINFSGPAEAPAQLRERLRLNSFVYRTFIQSA